jgi:hypothetical protein
MSPLSILVATLIEPKFFVRMNEVIHLQFVAILVTIGWFIVLWRLKIKMSRKNLNIHGAILAFFDTERLEQVVDTCNL